MKKLLLSGSIAALLLPGLALAAYNDVSLNVGTVLTVGSATLNVQTTSANLASIAVGASSFTVTLQPNSSIEIQSAAHLTLATDAEPAYISTNTCSSTESVLKLVSSMGTATITITPGSACTGSTATGSSSTTSTSSGSGSNGAPVASGGGGGGGGGGGVTAITPETPATAAGAPAAKTTDKQALAAQLTAQVNALNAQLKGMGGASAAASFKRDLQIGASGSDAKALQVYLNAHGFTVSSSGAGAPGKETTKFGTATKAALIKFQKAKGITPAAGYFGAKTRAYIAAHP